MHINERKGKIALFYTANNVLLTPLLFTILLFSFRNFLIPIFPSSSSSFLLFSLHHHHHHRHISIVFPPPPPPPHFYCFPSTTTTATFLFFSLHHPTTTTTATTFLLFSLNHHHHHRHHISIVFPILLGSLWKLYSMLQSKNIVSYKLPDRQPKSKENL